MTWVKLDDGFFRNTKAIAAGRDGRALYLAGLCYCAAGETDGAIVRDAIRIIAADADVKPTVASRLVEVGLWEATEDGWHVPDYLLYNPSREKLRQERDAARSRMQARRSGDVRANTGANNARSSPSPSRPVPYVDTSSSSSTSPGEPSGDDVEEVLRLFVERKAATSTGIRNAEPWKRTALANARLELAVQVRDWLDRYDVTPTQAADALLAGGVPASWAYCRKAS